MIDPAEVVAELRKAAQEISPPSHPAPRGSFADGSTPQPARARLPTLKPGHRVKDLTFVEFRRGGWVCDCACGARQFLSHATIHTRGKCDECVESPDTDAEESLRTIAAELGVTHQRVHQIYESACENFDRNWTRWRLIMDTDLETADRPTLWQVVQACRILGAALDARAPQV